MRPTDTLTADVPESTLAIVYSPNPYGAIASSLGKLPIQIFHGDSDETVPVTASRNMAAALEAVGANYHYTEYPGVHHQSWEKAYADEKLIKWMFAQKKENVRVE